MNIAKYRNCAHAIAQNRAAQIRNSKILCEMIFAQNSAKCCLFAQKCYATEENFCIPFSKKLRNSFANGYPT